MGSGSYLFGQETANTSASSGLANKALSWEKTGAWNIGVDFSMFNDRLSGNIDYYSSKTVDLLLNRAIPVMNGFQNVSDNIGEVKNWGLEFSLRSRNIETKDFSWSTGLNFWMNRNKVVSLYGLDGDGDGVDIITPPPPEPRIEDEPLPDVVPVEDVPEPTDPDVPTTPSVPKIPDLSGLTGGQAGENQWGHPGAGNTQPIDMGINVKPSAVSLLDFDWDGKENKKSGLSSLLGEAFSWRGALSK